MHISYYLRSGFIFKLLYCATCFFMSHILTLWYFITIVLLVKEDFPNNTANILISADKPWCELYCVFWFYRVLVILYAHRACHMLYISKRRVQCQCPSDLCNLKLFMPLQLLWVDRRVAIRHTTCSLVINKAERHSIKYNNNIINIIGVIRMWLCYKKYAIKRSELSQFMMFRKNT